MKKLFYEILVSPKVAVALHDGVAMKLTPGPGNSPEEMLKNTQVDFTVMGPDATHAAIPIELFRQMLLAFMRYVALAHISVAEDGKFTDADGQEATDRWTESCVVCFDLMNDWFIGAVNEYNAAKAQQKGALN